MPTRLIALLTILLLAMGCSAAEDTQTSDNDSGQQERRPAEQAELPSVDSVQTADDAGAESDSDIALAADESSSTQADAVQAAPGQSAADQVQQQQPLDAYFPTEDVVSQPADDPEPIPVNPFVDALEDNLSTFGLDVDTGAYTLARAAINNGIRPEPASVRLEEFVNAFDYGYQPDSDETFTVQADLAPWPYATEPDNALLRIGLSTPYEENREPASLVFVVDTSGSMTELLPLVQDSLRTLVTTLSPGDQVAIVTYSDAAEPVLHATDASQRPDILDGIDRLRIGGSTNLEAGLDLGYDIAGELAQQGRTTRVVLSSDGIANVGNTTPEAILDTVDQGATEGIELVTVGFGLRGFNDPLMEQLADQGDGFYAYVDTLSEAETLFAGDLIATRPAVARDARAQVVFDADQVTRYRLLGYENRDIADEDFRDDTVDAGELVAGHTVTALYEVELTGSDTGNPLATVQLRWLDPQDGAARERAHDVTADDLTRRWEDAPESFQLAGTVAAWAEWLRDTPGFSSDPVNLLEETDRLTRLLQDPAVDELRDLIAETV